MNQRLLWQKFLSALDRLLDKYTSYTLVLYFLYALVGLAVVFAAFGDVPFKWYQIIISVVWLILVCRGANTLLAREFKIPKNKNSDLITALILVLILSPPTNFKEFIFVTIAGVVAMASKYILVLGRRHIFNPAALGAYATGAIFHYYASWWVGTKVLILVTLIGGFLVLRKIQRFQMSLVFLGVYLAALAINILLDQPASEVWHILWLALGSSSLLFFAFIMLTEPLTSPRSRRVYIFYAALVGILYAVPNFGLNPEEVLLIGNIFAFLMQPDPRVGLALVRKKKEAKSIESFIFKGKTGLKFQPGQYLEWTIPDNHSDSRGNRRFLTIASSPTEPNLMFSVKMPEKRSSFKQALEKFESGDTILADQLAGTFVLPQSEKQKLVFVAGGIGVTPFRSMIKYILDFEQERDIVLLYSANDAAEFAFNDLFEEAEKVGVKTIYSVTGDKIPAGWNGLSGPLTKESIEAAIEDFAQRTFYVSGPSGFVHHINAQLYDMGLYSRQIITDYFPGYN